LEFIAALYRNNCDRYTCLYACASSK